METWFRSEFERCLQDKDTNENEMVRLTNRVNQLDQDTKLRREQCKAIKRQNKLLLVALNKTAIQKDDLDN